MSEAPARRDGRIDPAPLPSTRSLWRDGLWTANPGLVTLLGLCPLLAVGNTTINALGLGLATLVTLLVTNVAVSLSRHHVPAPVRLPMHVLIIATSVTAIEITMQAWLPELHAALGIFLPLIVTNCLILGRAQAFASRVPVTLASVDALATQFGELGGEELCSTGGGAAEAAIDRAGGARLDVSVEVVERQDLNLRVAVSGADRGDGTPDGSDAG